MRIRKFLLPILIAGFLMCCVSGMANATTIGLWLFDEGTGDTAYDSSTFDNDGTVNNASWVTDTPFSYSGNHALRFDGSGDNVVVAPSDSLNSFTNAVTIEAWVKGDESSISNYDYTLAKWYSGGQATFALDAFDNGRLRFYVTTEGTSGWTDTWFSGTIWDNQWHHIAGVYDSTASGNNVLLYVDGTLADSDSVTGDLNIEESGSFYIGSYGTGYYFPGFIDEVRLSDVALDSSQLGYHGSPVPEPATMLLLGSGLIGLAGLKRKFRNT